MAQSRRISFAGRTKTAVNMYEVAIQHYTEQRMHMLEMEAPALKSLKDINNYFPDNQLEKFSL